MKIEIKIALIGAAATIVAALVVGVLGLFEAPNNTETLTQEKTHKDQSLKMRQQEEISLDGAKKISSVNARPIHIPSNITDSTYQAAIVDIQHSFTPSGWMGDGVYDRKYIEFTEAYSNQPHSHPSSIKVSYHFGPKNWAGLCWQNIPNNWGEHRGNDYSGKGISHATYWARGKTGREVLEFKVGGINDNGKKYGDSLARTSHRIGLTKEWQKYQIDLTGSDLSSVIGGFCWIASKDYNKDTAITFYLDDIVFQ